jgi:Histidine kinase
VLISVATHDLRDKISRSQAEREALQERLRELSVIEDRDRIAAELRDKIIQRIFAAGLSLQGAAGLTTDAEVRRRVGTSIDELDNVVRLLRDTVFDLEHRLHRGGLRQEVLGVCGKLSPVPEIGFSGQAEEALSAEVQARLLELLRVALGLIEPDAVPGRVEIAADADTCLLVIDAASRERADGGSGTEQDFSSLLDQATQARVRMDIESTPGGIRFSWQFPLGLSVRPAAADIDRDLRNG